MQNKTPCRRKTVIVSLFTATESTIKQIQKECKKPAWSSHDEKVLNTLWITKYHFSITALNLLICSYQDKEELVLLSVGTAMTSLQVRLALSCAQAALAAIVDKGRNMGENICRVPLSCSLYHALLEEGFVDLQRTGIFMKVTPERIHVSFCLFTVGACKKK